MFDFVFRLYNFVSLANEDNKTLRDPFDNVDQATFEVKNAAPIVDDPKAQDERRRWCG
jgi:hypothetical protein